MFIDKKKVQIEALKEIKTKTKNKNKK